MTLTEYLLTCLGEEGCEISQATSKALRFGLPDVNLLKPSGPTNCGRIVEELNDLIAVVDLCVEQGLLPEDWLNAQLIAAKKKKLVQFMEYSEERGALQLPQIKKWGGVNESAHRDFGRAAASGAVHRDALPGGPAPAVPAHDEHHCPGSDRRTDAHPV